MSTTNLNLVIFCSGIFEFIKFSCERGTKTWTGETARSVNTDAQVFKSKMCATPDRPERSQVRIFQQCFSRFYPEMCKDDSPFYLLVNHKHKPRSYWYKKLPFGIHVMRRDDEKADKDGSLKKRSGVSMHCCFVMAHKTIDNSRICHCLLFHECGKQNFVQPFLRSWKLIRYTHAWTKLHNVVMTWLNLWRLWVSLCMNLTWRELNYCAWFDGTICEQPGQVWSWKKY